MGPHPATGTGTTRPPPRSRRGAAPGDRRGTTGSPPPPPPPPTARGQPEADQEGGGPAPPPPGPGGGGAPPLGRAATPRGGPHVRGKRCCMPLASSWPLTQSRSARGRPAALRRRAGAPRGPQRDGSTRT